MCICLQQAAAAAAAAPPVAPGASGGPAVVSGSGNSGSGGAAGGLSGDMSAGSLPRQASVNLQQQPQQPQVCFGGLVLNMRCANLCLSALSM